MSKRNCVCGYQSILVNSWGRWFNVWPWTRPTFFLRLGPRADSDNTRDLVTVCSSCLSHIPWQFDSDIVISGKGMMWQWPCDDDTQEVSQEIRQDSLPGGRDGRDGGSWEFPSGPRPWAPGPSWSSSAPSPSSLSAPVSVSPPLPHVTVGQPGQCASPLDCPGHLLHRHLLQGKLSSLQ